MAEAASKAGLSIYEHTNMVSHEANGDGSHVLTSLEGHRIEAEYVVYAVGYEPEELKPKLQKAVLHRSYVIVTPVQTTTQAWHGKWLIWETARPYLYLRTTVDGRFIVGGLDEDKQQPITSENRQHRKSEQLAGLLRSLFPEADHSIAYEWNGTFGESRDDLPFIGQDRSLSNVFYCLGYGGNGSVYSMIGAKILADLIRSGPRSRKNHPMPFIDIR